MADQNYHPLDRVSEEAFSGFTAHPITEADVLAELGLSDLGINTNPVGLGTENLDDIDVLFDSYIQSEELIESHSYVDTMNRQNPCVDQDHYDALMDNFPVNYTIKEKKHQSSPVQILLSQCVDVGQPQMNMKEQSHAITIVHDLEEHFRARYKSDYFAQNGKKRKPRYIMDALGNHFVTVQVPVNVPGILRIDWLTIPDEFGNRYLMPYMFQQDNERGDIPDCNPLFLDVKGDQYGKMKLYLVLIKSKQDALKSLQPLIPFQPYRDAIDNPSKTDVQKYVRLNPKQLIQKYQLEKSQLAITFCSISSDGKSCIPEWNTTVYSSVLSEAQPESYKRRAVTCPRCNHSFQNQTEVDNEDDNDDTYTVVQTTGSNKRKATR